MRVGGRGALVDRAHHPPGSVHADEADVRDAFGGAHPGTQLGAIFPSTSSACAPSPISDAGISARTSSQMPSLRGAANAELQRARPVDQEYLLDAALVVGGDPDLHALHRRQLEAAQVHPLHAGGRAR